MTKHLRLAVAAFSATALLLAGCADDADDTTTLDPVDTEETDTDDDGLDDEGDDDLLEDDEEEEVEG
jgi:hypothetical protein